MGSETIEASIVEDQGEAQGPPRRTIVEIDGERLVVQAASAGAWTVSREADPTGHQNNIWLDHDTQPSQAMLAGQMVPISVLDARQFALRKGQRGGQGGDLKAPMPGRVVKVCAEVGNPVTQGQPVIILEAMKMENELMAPADAILDKIAVAPGDAVEAGQVLVSFRAQDAGSS